MKEMLKKDKIVAKTNGPEKRLGRIEVDSGKVRKGKTGESNHIFY